MERLWVIREGGISKHPEYGNGRNYEKKKPRVIIMTVKVQKKEASS